MSTNRSFSKRRIDPLSAHADTLVSGDERASQLPEHHVDEDPILESLFEVSRELHEMLVPITPRSQFVSGLKTELRDSQTTLVASRQEQRRRRAMRVINTVGIILSVLAVTALMTRLIGVIIMLKTYRARRRRVVVTA